MRVRSAMLRGAILRFGGPRAHGNPEQVFDLHGEIARWRGPAPRPVTYCLGRNSQAASKLGATHGRRLEGLPELHGTFGDSHVSTLTTVSVDRQVPVAGWFTLHPTFRHGPQDRPRERTRGSVLA